MLRIGEHLRVRPTSATSIGASLFGTSLWRKKYRGGRNDAGRRLWTPCSQVQGLRHVCDFKTLDSEARAGHESRGRPAFGSRTRRRQFQANRLNAL